uniref:Uncharacterized protein n=1 Tax=Arundo donax TaxID=35708 RepID=A0A0A9HIF9_ARUDO
MKFLLLVVNFVSTVYGNLNALLSLVKPLLS